MRKLAIIMPSKIISSHQIYFLCSFCYVLSEKRMVNALKRICPLPNYWFYYYNWERRQHLRVSSREKLYVLYGLYIWIFLEEIVLQQLFYSMF